MQKGKIASVIDHGSVWTIFYKPENDRMGSVAFDWRCLANFYEGTSGRNFYRDYQFGQGRKTISEHFVGRTLYVEEEDGVEYVSMDS